MGIKSGRLPTNSNYSFSRSPSANIPRSSFNRSHAYKTTFNEGYLIPVFLDEALPGDTLNCRMTAFARMSTPIYPIMDNLYLESFFFAVPYRLIWDNWEKFNGAQTNPGDSTSFLVPTTTAPVGGHLENTLQDYMGIPTKRAGLVYDNLFPRAYNLIWNTWFRDQNLQNSVTVDTGDGPDTVTNYVLLQRGKRHDYFTSCLPFAQKGTAVSVPLGSTAPVKGIGVTSTFNFPSAPTVRESGGSGTVNYAFGQLAGAGGVGSLYFKGTANPGYPDIYADLSAATGSTINALRQSFQIQKMYERDARGGTRYIELIKAHFNVDSDDARQQRPEYLGGGSSPVVIHPVPQTSVTAATPLGTLSAYGTVTTNNHGFTKSFTEHCLIIGLVNVRADLNYQQGLDRMWSRQTRFDFYWPALSHIGEQAVLNKEIYADATANDALTFGYQERFAEYRYKPSKCTGLFRSNATGTLDAWHLAQNFASLPALNSTFIVENAPMTRILAVNTQPHFLFDSFFNYKCARPMPVYSVPGLIDHF